MDEETKGKGIGVISAITAEKIYDKLSNLEGEWVHDSSEFLPANVCCDHVGNVRFKKMLSEIIYNEFKKEED